MDKKLPSINSVDANRVRDMYLNGNSIDISSIELSFIGETGTELTDYELNSLAIELEKIQEKFPQVSKSNGGKIDSEVVEPLHMTLLKYTNPQLLQEEGFWFWLSNMACDGFFCRFIDWRHEINGKKGHPRNWRLTVSGKMDMIEAYFSRIWKRGEMMFDPDEPKGTYYYAKLGSSEVWRSQILRQSRFKDREFIKAFLDTIYGTNGGNRLKIGQGGELRSKLMPAIGEYLKTGRIPESNYQESFDLLQKLLGRSISPEVIEKVTNEVKNGLIEDGIEPDVDIIDNQVEWRLTEVLYRHEQTRFRKEVKENCNQICIITGEPHVNVCHACHIKDARFNGPFIVENGLFMRSDWHSLFDRGEVLIHESGIIELNSDFSSNSEYQKFENKKANLPSNINKYYLNWKYNRMKIHESRNLIT